MAIGVIGVVLGIAILVLDDTKTVVTYVAALGMIAIGIGVISTGMRSGTR